MINNKLEYDAALIRIQNLKWAEPGSPEMTLLDELTTQAEYYEENNFLSPDMELETGKHFFMVNGMGLVDRLYVNSFSSSEQVYYVTNLTSRYAFGISRKYFEAHKDHYFSTRQFAVMASLRDLYEQREYVERKLSELQSKINSLNEELNYGNPN